jgi:glycosyltransferase involved in cell wall biosynthesis
MTASPPRSRVLQVTSTAQIGGAEQLVLRLLEHYDRSRFEMAVVAMEPEGPFLDEVAKTGAEATGLPSQNPFSPWTRRAFAALLESGGFSLVHIHGLRADILARGLVRRAGPSGPLTAPACVSAIHSPDPWRRFYHVWADRWTARGGRVDLFISVSEAGRQSRIEREKFPPEKIIVIPNGVDPERVERKGEVCDHRESADCAVAAGASESPRRDRKRAEAAVAEDSGAACARCGLPTHGGPLVVIVSNLRYMKGHYDAIRALAFLREDFAGLRFAFAGRDDTAGAVEAAARKAGVYDRILFCGFVPDPFPLMRAADVFCMPSHWEGSPTALLEAMALGCAIVATTGGGTPEIVRHEREALLVSPRDSRALAAAIARLLRDRDLGRRLGAAARERVRQDFTAQQMVARIEEAYAELLA